VPAEFHNRPKRFSMLIDHWLAVFIDEIHVHERVIHVYMRKSSMIVGWICHELPPLNKGRFETSRQV
jgi:hypothetical protein